MRRDLGPRWWKLVIDLDALGLAVSTNDSNRSRLQGAALRLLLAIMALMTIGACATWAAPAGKLPSDSRIGVTVTRTAGRFHLRVLVAAPCQTNAGGKCPEGKPMSELAIALRTPRGDRLLGTTWVDGTLEVPFSQIEALLPEQRSDKSRRAPLLVEGRIVADLPVGEIPSRETIIELAIQECDEALADPNLQSDYAQDLLGRMLDLQLIGLADNRLAERTTRLAERVRAKPAAMWSAPKLSAERAEALLAGMRATGGEHVVPADVKRELAHRSADEPIESSSFRWALDWLPTVCKVTVRGGELLSQVVVTGPAGIALAVIEATVGEIYTEWLIKTCCQRGGDVLGAAGPLQCS